MNRSVLMALFAVFVLAVLMYAAIVWADRNLLPNGITGQRALVLSVTPAGADAPATEASS